MKTKTVIALLTLFFTAALPAVNTLAQTPDWQWAKSISGNANETCRHMATDPSGNVYIVGDFKSASITIGTTILFNTNAGSEDVFIAKYDRSGNVLWAKCAGGSSTDYGFGICTDAGGNVYITGSFESTSITFDAFTLSNAGSSEFDGFIVKYSPSGSVLWAKRMGGSSWDDGYSITSDLNGNIFVTGDFDSDIIDFGGKSLTRTGTGINFYLVKYDPAGTVLWAKNANGSGTNIDGCIAADANGNVVVSGPYQGSTMTFGSVVLPSGFYGAVFIVKYSASGTVLWAKSADGCGYETSYGIATDPSNNIYITGTFQSASISFDNIKLINSELNAICTGNFDMFIVKYNSTGSAVWAKCYGSNDPYGDGYVLSNSIVSDGSASIYAIGTFNSDSLVFDTPPLKNSFSGTNDIFIAKFDYSGNAVWSKNAGSSGSDWGTGIVTGSNGDVFVSGDFWSQSVNFGNNYLTNTGGSDIYTGLLSGICSAATIAVQPQNQTVSEGTPATFSVTPSGTPPFTYQWYVNGQIPHYGEVSTNSTYLANIPPTEGNGFSYYCLVFNCSGSNAVKSNTAILATNLGIGEPGKNEFITLYPNPASGKFTVSMGIGRIQRIEIYNVYGEKIYATSSVGQQASSEVEISGIPKGVYFVNIYDATTVYVRKIVVQ